MYHVYEWCVWRMYVMYVPYGFVWYTIALHFIAIHCANLSSPFNGAVAFDANTVGSQANYSCNEGYVLNDTTTRVCQADGQWSGSEPTCEGWGPTMCTWCV